MKLLLVVSITLCLQADASAGQPAPKSDVAVEVHLKAVKLVEISGARERILASFRETIAVAKAEMKKQCPDCTPAFFAEWGKRMAARLKVDDFVNVAARAYAKRFTSDELTELLAVVSSQKTDKPVPLSPALQKKALDLMPAIMGEIVGGSTEIGARLGADVGAEIAKEHPEYTQPKPKSNEP